MKNMRMNKFILTGLLGLISLAGFAQGQPTGAKTQFKNGVALGSKDSTSFGANDSLFLTIDRNNKLMWRGNGASATWRVAGSSADLLAYLLKSDSAIYFNQVVRTFGTQTIDGNKTFNSTLNVGGSTLITGGAFWANGNIANFGLRYDFGNSEALVAAALSPGGSGGMTMGRNLSYSNTGAPNLPSFATNGTVSAFHLSNGGSVNVYAQTFGSGGSVAGLSHSRFDSTGNFRVLNGTAFLKNMANGSSSDSVLVSNNGEVRKILQSSIGSGSYLPLSGGTLTGALSGTSLSMSGAISGARVVQNNSTQTQGEFWGWSAFQGASTNTGEIRMGGNSSIQGRFYYTSSGNTATVIENTFDDAAAEIRFRTRVTGTAVTPLTMSANGLVSTTTYNVTVGATNRDLFVDNTGLIGYVSSFRASKKNIQPFTNTSWIYGLNPVTFNYRIKDKKGKYTDSAYNELEYGLIAEEVESVNKELVFYDVDTLGNKKLRGVHYSKLVIPLLKEIQDQKKKIDNLEARLQKIEAILNKK